jgi:O-antigen/teichoic acid export membrane protein
MEEFKAIALRSVLFKLIGLVLMYLFVKKIGDYKIYLCIMMFSFLGNNILSFFLLNDKVKFVFSGLQLRRHIMPLLFIFGTTLVAVIADIDTVLLGFLTNDKTVGLYTAAVKLSKISIPIVTSMSIILIPKIAKDFADGKMADVQLTLNQAFRFVVFFGVPITFGLALLAPEFITLFSGREFIEATNSMRLLSLLPLIMGFSHFFLFMILVPSGRNREMFVSELVGLIVSLGLNFLLIPYLRQIGSSIADICSETSIILLYFYFINKHFAFTFQWSLLVKAIITALVFIPLVWAVKELSLSLVYRLAVSISSCAIIYAAIQLFLFKNNYIADVVNIVKLKLDKTAPQ